MYGQSTRGGPPEPAYRTVKAICSKFHKSGSILDAPRPGRPRQDSEESVEAVASAFENNPHTSLRKLGQQLDLTYFMTRKIARNILKMYPYKISVRQQLNEGDLQKCMEFATKTLLKIARDDNFLDNLIITDEAHFHLNGYVNNQNFRFWGKTNPHLCVETPLHSLKVTAWCGVSRSRVYGPYWFLSTITQESYRKLLSDSFLPALEQEGSKDSVWFQQDGATPHTAGLTREFLKNHWQ